MRFGYVRSSPSDDRSCSPALATVEAGHEAYLIGGRPAEQPGPAHVPLAPARADHQYLTASLAYADRVYDTDEHNWDRAGCLLQRAYTRTARGHNDVRRKCDQFRRISAGIPTVKAVVNVRIAAVGPTQLLQRL